MSHLLNVDELRAAREAHRRADQLSRDVLARWPDAWEQMDWMRRSRPMPWPEWCLLPMAAAATVVGGLSPREPNAVATVAALYAWRYSRAVYVVEPALLDRLLTQVPDHVGVDELAGLPHWAVYVTGVSREWPGAGLWAHLEYDVNTGRPELRLVIDLGEPFGQSLAVPVYLDRPTVTEAIADWRATALASLGRRGADVRGGELDAAVARVAERVDGYLGLLAYLARPEADLVCVDRPGQRPVRPRSPVRDRTTWAVGFSLRG